MNEISNYGPTRRARMLIDTFEAAHGAVPEREKLIEAIATMLAVFQFSATPYTRDEPKAHCIHKRQEDRA